MAKPKGRKSERGSEWFSHGQALTRKTHALIRACREAGLVLDRAPPDFVVPPPPDLDPKCPKNLWQCPRCGARKQKRNRERHILADECFFVVECRARRANGWEILDLNSIRLAYHGEVTLWPGPVRLVPQFEGGDPNSDKPVRVRLPKVYDVAEIGLWVPAWFHEARWLSRGWPPALRCGLFRGYRSTEYRETIQSAARLGACDAARQIVEGLREESERAARERSGLAQQVRPVR